MPRGIRARLERLEREQEESGGFRPDWDSLGRGDWPTFAASVGPPPAPDPETLARRARLAEVCSELGCTRRELGLIERPEDIGIVRYRTHDHEDQDAQPASGFVQVPSDSPPNPAPARYASTNGDTQGDDDEPDHL